MQSVEGRGLSDHQEVWLILIYRWCLSMRFNRYCFCCYYLGHHNGPKQLLVIAFSLSLLVSSFTLCHCLPPHSHTNECFHGSPEPFPMPQYSVRQDRQSIVSYLINLGQLRLIQIKEIGEWTPDGKNHSLNGGRGKKKKDFVPESQQKTNRTINSVNTVLTCFSRGLRSMFAFRASGR